MKELTTLSKLKTAVPIEHYKAGMSLALCQTSVMKLFCVKIVNDF